MNFGGDTGLWQRKKPIALINNAMNENSFGLWTSRLVATFFTDQKSDEAEVNVWLAQLSRADSEKRSGFVSVPALTAAVAI